MSRWAAISAWRTRASASARSCASAASWTTCALGRLGDGALAVDLALAGRLLGGDALDLERDARRDARGLDRLVGGDLAPRRAPAARDLAGPRRLLGGDAVALEPGLDARCGRSRSARARRCRPPRRRGCGRSRARGSPARRRCGRRRSAFSRAMRAASVAWRAAISASSSACCALDLQLADPAVGADALLAGRGGLEDAQLLGRLARGDLGFLDGARCARSRGGGFPPRWRCGSGDGPLLRDAGLLGRLARRRSRPASTCCWLAISRVWVSCSLAMRASLTRAFLEDAGVLDLLAAWRSPRRRWTSGARSRAGGSRARRRCGSRRSPARWRCGALDRLAGGDLGALGLGLALGALARELGALLGAAELDLALLLEPGLLAGALDGERLLLGLEVARADRDHRALLDVVAQRAALLDVLDERGQAFGVEAVGGVEEFEAGLVDVDDGDGFELEAVARRGPPAPPHGRG